MFPDHIYISHQDWKGNVYKVILARMLEREKMGMCKAWMSFTNFWANLPNEFKTLAISFSESGTQLSGLLRDQIQTARAACMFATETAH